MYVLNYRAALFANPDLFSILNTRSEPSRFSARRTDNHRLGNRKKCRHLQNLSVLSLFARPYMFFLQIHTLRQQKSSFGIHAQNFRGFAAVFAGNYFDGVAFLDFHKSNREYTNQTPIYKLVIRMFVYSR